MTFYDKHSAVVEVLMRLFLPIDVQLGSNDDIRLNFNEEKGKLKKSYYLISLHNHSSFSDGKLDLESYIAKAIKNDYDIVSITDHNNTKAFKSLYESKEIGGFKKEIVNDYTIKISGDDKVLYFLKGEEITTKEGHITVIGRNIPRSGLSLEDTLNNMEKDNFVIANHPLIIDGIGEENLRKYQSLIDAVEVNGSIAFPFSLYYNTKAKIISEEIGKAVIANPDAHIIGAYFNSFLTLIEKNSSFDEDKIIAYIKEMLNSERYVTVEQNSNNLKIIKWTLSYLSKKHRQEVKNSL